MYYQKLDGVRTAGDFEDWILFYLNAIRESCSDAYQHATAIEQLEHTLIQRIQSTILQKLLR